MTVCPRCKRQTPRPGGHTTPQGCLEASARQAVQRLAPLPRGLSPKTLAFVLDVRRKHSFSHADVQRLATLLVEHFDDGSLSAELAGQQWLL